MKRIGHLMEKMMTVENFTEAEKRMAQHKPDNRKARYLAANAEEKGTELLNRIINGEFKWHQPRETTIKDSYKGKERHLKIPCLEDQVAQQAWLIVAEPYLLRRNYYYCCGSVPGAGQTRATKSLQHWMKSPKRKYGAALDIRKFYESCPHWAIEKALRRIFKDEAFIQFAMGFIATMSNNGIGIAIGYPISHWLANLVLTHMDHETKRQFKGIKYVRYMDDMALVSANKRRLKKAILFIRNYLQNIGMRLKKWQWFQIAAGRPLTFLSYRFYHGYTLMTKPLMIRISRRMRKASMKLNAHTAAGVISLMGILKHCDSYNFRQTYVYPFVNLKACKRLISIRSRKQAFLKLQKEMLRTA